MEESKEAKAARNLREALRAAESGSNEHGVYWTTAKLVPALRAFYKEMDGG